MKSQTATKYPDDFILKCKKLFIMYGLGDMPMDCLFMHLDGVGKKIGWSSSDRIFQHKSLEDGYIEAFDSMGNPVKLFEGHRIIRFTDKFVEDFL